MAEALQKAKEANLDLVEIAPTAQPPVCRIMNFGKFIYQQKKKQQDSKKKQKTTQVKEVKFRPNIDDHDYDFKMKNIEKFLAHGDKVKATVQFRGREMARRENGQKVLDRLLVDHADDVPPEVLARQDVVRSARRLEVRGHRSSLVLRRFGQCSTGTSARSTLPEVRATRLSCTRTTAPGRYWWHSTRGRHSASTR